MNDAVLSALHVGTQPLPGVRYDGVMGRDWLQFTELDPASPAFTASFYLTVDGYSLAALMMKRSAVANKFSKPVAR